MPDAVPDAVPDTDESVDTVSEVEPAARDALRADGGQEGGGEAFALHLPAFDGPLDLLLHLIEREELDVTEVSLLAVTEQYLSHLRSGDHLDPTALAQFISVGARLLLLKSRALLPRDPDGASVSEQEDGDADSLVAALEEYRRYRRAAEHLRSLEEEGRTGYRREATPPDVPLPTGLDGVSSDTLFALFRDVLDRIVEEEDESEAIERDPVPLAGLITSLAGRLDREERISFRSFISEATTRIEVVVSFLAVLELLKAGFLRASQPEAFGDIELLRIEGAVPPSDVELEQIVEDAAER